MLPELKEVKPLRKKFGLTQKELSEKAGISQAMIAKIESGKVAPAYDKAKRIFAVLDAVKEKKSLKAGKIATKKIIFVEGNKSLEQTVKLMERKAISQLPVLKGNKVLGIITEKSLLNYMREGKKIKGLKAKNLAGDNFALLPETIDVETVSRLFGSNIQAVLLTKKEKITGIITRADLLKAALKK